MGEKPVCPGGFQRRRAATLARFNKIGLTVTYEVLALLTLARFIKIGSTVTYEVLAMSELPRPLNVRRYCRLIFLI